MPSSVRGDMIEQLVNAGLDGMQTVGGTYSGAELLSAVFTLALRTVKATLVKNPECLPYVKQAVGILLLECAEPSKLN